MNVTKLLYSAKKGFIEHSPEILLVSGIVSFVGTVVLACVATSKMPEVLDEHKAEIEDVKETSEDYDCLEDSKNYLRKEKAIIFAKTGAKVMKVYGPSVITGAISITCFLASYKIIHGRYVAAMSLAAGLSKTLSTYRKRVIDELGKEMDEHFFNGTERKTVRVNEDDGNGNVIKKNEKVQTLVDGNGFPIYAKFFDESNENWNKNASLNLMFILGQQARANDLFRIRGYLLLNDVYHLLGLPATDIGGMVGWFEGHGDQFIDFGLYDGSERRRAFVNGYEPSILLNFNCVPKMEGDLAKF